MSKQIEFFDGCLTVRTAYDYTQADKVIMIHKGEKPREFYPSGANVQGETERANYLEKRLKHLLLSDYIRSFDEINPNTKEYVRDIREADFTDSVNSQNNNRLTLKRYIIHYKNG